MAYNTPIKKHYTVAEQRDRLPLYLREYYETRQLDRIKIDGNEIQGYFEYSFINEKTYVKSPERSSNGSIDNLNSYATFLTPRLVIKYNYMHISDYRKLMLLLRSKNEFVVECYDIVLDKRVTHKMYHATPEMPNVHQRYLEVLGVKDYTVELIGTNVSLDVVEIRYYDENGVLISEATQSVDKGIDALIKYDYVAPDGFRFEGEWNTQADFNGVTYHNGDTIYMDGDLELYAKVNPSNQYTLSFSYGNGNVLYSQTAGAVNSVPINYGNSLNTAISNANIILDSGQRFTFPENGTGGLSILYEEQYIVPYEFKGWYWTPEANDGMKVNGSTIFNYALNRTIFQIYEPKQYRVTYETNTGNVIAFAPQDVAYGARVPLPSLRMAGYTFIGWYMDTAFENVFTGSMPPKDITLYAKWEKNTQ